MGKPRGNAAVLATENSKKLGKNGKKQWKKPTLDDVSGRVMAQPYIRFT